MVLSGRVKPLNSCLPHISHVVCQVGSVLPLPTFSYQYSSLLCLVWAASCHAHAGVPVVGLLPGLNYRVLVLTKVRPQVEPTRRGGGRIKFSEY